MGKKLVPNEIAVAAPRVIIFKEGKKTVLKALGGEVVRKAQPPRRGRVVIPAITDQATLKVCRDERGCRHLIDEVEDSGTANVAAKITSATKDK